jgi:hypothetical protein
MNDLPCLIVNCCSPQPVPVLPALQNPNGSLSGELRLTSFNARAQHDLAEAIKQMEAEGVKVGGCRGAILGEARAGGIGFFNEGLTQDALPGGCYAKVAHVLMLVCHTSLAHSYGRVLA